MENERKILCADHAYKKGLHGRGVTIAFLDTGITMLPDFGSPNSRILAFVDVIGNGGAPYDDNGHGTHVGGGLA